MLSSSSSSRTKRSVSSEGPRRPGRASTMISSKDDGNNHNNKKHVLIVGATGYLGRHLVQEYLNRSDDWEVSALVRRKQQQQLKEEEGTISDQKTHSSHLNIDWSRVHQVVAQVTEPETLDGCCFRPNENRTNAAEATPEQKKLPYDVVISALGITRQRDGLTYRDVDYQANVNVLEEALRAGVPHFGYIHVLKGRYMAEEKKLIPIQAKQDFVNRLQSESDRIKSTIVSPSGFFSDMRDFLDMAGKEGRVWLFGRGTHTINPIHGADLAKFTADTIEERRTNDGTTTSGDSSAEFEVGGPDLFTHTELGELAFECLERDPVRIIYIWDGIRTFLIAFLPWVTPITVWGPASFFLTAFGEDMEAPMVGTHHLKDHWKEEIAKQ